MLRIRLAGLAAALFLGLSPALAQQAAPAELPPVSHLQVARDVLNLSGVSGPMYDIYEEFSANIKQSLVTRPETHKDLDTALKAMKPELDKRVEEIIAVASLIFARNLSEPDLKEIKAFFESPVGRRYSDTRAKIINDIYTELQPWALKTSDFMYNFVRDEMKKKGHEIGG